MSNPDYASVVTNTCNRYGADAKLTERLLQSIPGYFVQDTFTTVAVISDSKTGEVLGAAASKRNPIDRQNQLRGKALALSRAVQYAILRHGDTSKWKQS